MVPRSRLLVLCVLTACFEPLAVPPASTGAGPTFGGDSFEVRTSRSDVQDAADAMRVADSGAQDAEAEKFSADLRDSDGGTENQGADPGVLDADDAKQVADSGMPDAQDENQDAVPDEQVGDLEVLQPLPDVQPADSGAGGATDTAKPDLPAQDVPLPDVPPTEVPPPDVPPSIVCGNGKCEAGETCASCQKDCGCQPAFVCSNGQCKSNFPPPPMPADCSFQAKVLTYNPKGWDKLGSAMAADPAVCADYFIHLPALAGDKTQPRGEPAVTQVHAYGGRFHALAEFHWGGWWDVKGMTWVEKGREFRKRMVQKGYIEGRDHWAINELPSTVRSDKAVRQAVRDVVKGLYEGPPGSSPMGGAVYVIGMGQPTQNFNVYKPQMKDWTLDAAFWQDMNAHVKWWGQEVYGHPDTVCVGSATVAQRSEAINVFAMHPARLADVGPQGATAARNFFDESYVPLGSAAWNSDTYNTAKLSLDQMKHFVSTQVYAARAWAATNKAPDARIALAWNDQLDGATEAQVADLAARVAAALHGAYDKGGPAASKACSSSGAFTWCVCAVNGAGFNLLWKSAFASW